MEPRAAARLEPKSIVFKALAHPSRLFIVEELAKGKRCVCELTAMIGADTSTVSKHLTILKNAGIIRDQKRGAQVYYELLMPCVLSFFGCIDKVIAERAEWQLEVTRETVS